MYGKLRKHIGKPKKKTQEHLGNTQERIGHSDTDDIKMHSISLISGPGFHDAANVLQGGLYSKANSCERFFPASRRSNGVSAAGFFDTWSACPMFGPIFEQDFWPGFLGTGNTMYSSTRTEKHSFTGLPGRKNKNKYVSNITCMQNLAVGFLLFLLTLRSNS